MSKIAPVCEIQIIDRVKVKKTIAKLPGSDETSRIAGIFKLLGDPTRLKIILSLIGNELCVCDLAAVINSTVSAVSHQLRLLKSEKLIKFRKDGKMAYYSIDDNHIRNLIDQLREHLNE